MSDDHSVEFERFLQKGRDLWNGVQSSFSDPDGINSKVLFQILRDNEGTEYGRSHDFAGIKSYDDYRKKVPLTVFDNYADMVYKELETGAKNLYSVYDIRQYNKSSGTMGNPKKIPMSSKSMDYVMGYQMSMPIVIASEKFGPAVAEGKFLSVMEASSLQYLSNGKLYAGVSAQTLCLFLDTVPWICTSPREASIPEPDTNSRYLHARYGLAEKNITIFHTTFATFILDMFHYIEANWEMICDDIEKGTIDPSVRMSDEVRANLEASLQPMPERAAELRAIFSEGFGPHVAKKIWPDLCYMFAVVTGTFEAYLKLLRERYIGDLPVLATGLSASEGIFTVPFEFNNPLTVPTVESVFFEFLPLGEDDPTKTLTIGQLELGGEYELIVTTYSGLYRYRTRDALRVDGFKDRMPLLSYLYRIDMCVNLNGEKTYEPAMRKAMDDTADELGFRYLDFCVYPDTDAIPSRYSFFVEKTSFPKGMGLDTVAKCLQKHLVEVNPVLEYKFDRNLIGPVKVQILQDETYLLYRDKLILKGGASTQVKPVKIIMNEAQLRFFKVLVDKDYN